MGMGSLDLSNASLEVGKQVTRLQIPHVDTSDLGQTHTTMGTDEWGNSRNSGECGEVHVVGKRVRVRITELLKVVGMAGGFREANDKSEPIKTSRLDGPERGNERATRV